jgi:hypothetical protein
MKLSDRIVSLAVWHCVAPNPQVSATPPVTYGIAASLPPVNRPIDSFVLFLFTVETGNINMTQTPIPTHILSAVQIGDSVDENGKPIGILTLGAVEGFFDFVITDKAADIIIEAMEGIKYAIWSN